MRRAKPTEQAAVQGPLVLVCGAFAAAALTQAMPQLFNRARVEALAKANHRQFVTKEIPARRGSIATSDGKVLAQSVDSFELGVSFAKSPRSPGFAVEMAAATGLPASEFDGKATGKYKIFQEPLTGAQASAVRDVRRRWRADGVSLVPVLNRQYPMGDAASNIVGIVRGTTGVTGFESSLDKKLAGTPGELEGMVDRTGLFMPNDNVKGTEASDGADVVLTIDSRLQSVAAATLRDAVEKHAATRGSAVVVDPRTGDVLAMASWPSYDPQGSIRPGTDIEAGSMVVLEPGSTFKVLTLAEALDTKAVAPDWQSVCPGQVEITKGHFVKCDLHHGNRAHGPVDLDKAIAKSCNVSAVAWAQAVGREKMIDMMKRLGLFERPGLELPGEVRGRYNTKDAGYKMQLANFGFGQALTATPAALAGAYATLANHGLRMPLRLVKSVGGKEAPAGQGERVFSAATSDLVRSYMRSVVEMGYGTGFGLRVDGYPLAGKTGTAQKVGPHGPAGHVSSFVGFVPADDTRAVILVMVDDPQKGGYYGAEVAGPVFHEIAKAVVKRFALAPAPRVPVTKATTIDPVAAPPVSARADKPAKVGAPPAATRLKKPTKAPTTGKPAKATKIVKPTKKPTSPAATKSPSRLRKSPASGTIRP
ncbi:MAG: hypothetical protein KF857_00385 [Fimbriimonadaceae bacterium]|nr:hypothetical protein [Fimbriimonadaceae bacterium]